MREIIYVQAGKLSNYTGTHFWNTQESYLAEDSAEKVYDFDVSFREGIDSTGRPTYCPRLLLFDHKSNFGTLTKSNALLGVNDNEGDGEESELAWNGHIAEYRHDAIPKSAYHASLDASNDYHDSWRSDEPEDSRKYVRYWSDFNRLFYTPRTIQKVKDPAEWENIEGDWSHGRTVFSEYDEDHGVMDESLRLFLEECDSPQGLQIMNDTSSFGGFMNSFLTAFRDQHTKLPLLVIPHLSSLPTETIDVDDLTSMRSMLNDAHYLHGLDDLTSMTIPIQPLGAWPLELWQDRLSVQPNDIYQNSAVLSALIETVTLPLRLKCDSISLSGLYGRMNWRGSTPFCELSGVFPFNDAEDFDTRIANLSISRRSHDPSYFTRLDVSRGFTREATSAYEVWSSRQPLNDRFVSSIHASLYPLPTSYPAFFKDVKSPAPIRKGILSSPESCSIFASLSTSSRTAYTFSSYASAIETYLKKKPGVDALGFERDDLKDLVNGLWTLYDNFGGEDEGL